jgi:hypothetical protein
MTLRAIQTRSQAHAPDSQPDRGLMVAPVPAKTLRAIRYRAVLRARAFRPEYDGGTSEGNRDFDRSD